MNDGSRVGELLHFTDICRLDGANGSFSFIHIFVPLTLWSSYKVIASARRRDFRTHRNEILGLYLGALTIPGVVAFALPGRLMNVWLFW